MGGKGHVSNLKKAGVAPFVLDKETKKRSITRNKEGYFITIKVSMHQEDITMINLYTLNNRASEIQEAIKFDPYFIPYLKITSK